MKDVRKRVRIYLVERTEVMDRVIHKLAFSDIDKRYKREGCGILPMNREWIDYLLASGP